MARTCKALLGNKHALGNPPNKTSFKKGTVPWNKGVHKAPSPKCRNTYFPKGHIPTNKQPIGTIIIRTSSNGYRSRFIKVRDVGIQNKNWRPYASWLWERKRGSLLPEQMIHHKDGDSLNDKLSNYKVVTRSSHIGLHRDQLTKARKASIAN